MSTPARHRPNGLGERPLVSSHRTFPTSTWTGTSTTSPLPATATPSLDGLHAELKELGAERAR